MVYGELKKIAAGLRSLDEHEVAPDPMPEHIAEYASWRIKYLQCGEATCCFAHWKTKRKTENRQGEKTMDATAPAEVKDTAVEQDPFGGLEPTFQQFSEYRETGKVPERFKSATEQKQEEPAKARDAGRALHGAQK